MTNIWEWTIVTDPAGYDRIHAIADRLAAAALFICEDWSLLSSAPGAPFDVDGFAAHINSVRLFSEDPVAGARFEQLWRLAEVARWN